MAINIKSKKILVGDSELFRFESKPRKLRKVLLVGNGAVNSGWLPLARALGCEWIKDADTVASLLAGFTFTYRQVKNDLLIAIHEQRKSPRELLKEFKDDLSVLRDVRWQVANAFENAQIAGTISLNKCAPIEELLSDPNEVGVITTNWDGLLWKQNQIANIIQLHGLHEHSDSLIFPSELGTDEQIYELARLTASLDETKEVIAEIGKHYRGLMGPSLRNAHGLAMQWLREADEITVWGLAVHPYDAELLTVIQNWAREKPKQTSGCVTIINPNPAHRERLAAILAAPSWVRREFDPVKNEWISPE